MQFNFRKMVASLANPLAIYSWVQFLKLVRWSLISIATALLLCGGLMSATAWSQDARTGDNAAATTAADAGLSQDELQRLAAEAAANRDGPPTPQADALKGSNLNVLDLLRQGGGIMMLIGVISLFVVAVAFERLFALRRGKLYPRGLRREIRKASDPANSFEPEMLFKASLRFRSAASYILHDMLRKIGRPISEVQDTLHSALQREADRLYGNVRWLTLFAAVTPLIGLLGTVWGMIIAFHDTTQLGAGSNKAEYLAEGIYVALVTTLGGLAVAIPAAVFAHFFEGRITKLMALIETELSLLLPRFEVHEGKSRYDIISQRGLVRRDPAADNSTPHVGSHTDTLMPPPVRTAARHS